MSADASSACTVATKPNAIPYPSTKDALGSGSVSSRSSVPVAYGDDDAGYVALALDKNVALGDVVAVGFKYVPGKGVAAK